MNRSPYRLLVFDWDGTLMDSVDRIVASIHAAIEVTGAEPRQPERIRGIIGLGLHEAVNQLYPGADDDFVTRLSAAYREHFLFQCTTPSRLFPGAMATLRSLHGAGYLLAVATGKGVRGLLKDLEETGTRPLFHATRTAEQTRSKPDPLMLEELVAELGVDRSDALMIGDTEFDMQMAASAGVDAVGLSCGVHPAERLHRHAPRAVLPAVEHLPDFLRQSRPVAPDRGPEFQRRPE